MHPSRREFTFPPARRLPAAGPRFRFPVLLVACLLSSGAVLAHGDENSPLRLDGGTPGGVRTSVTESWGSFDFRLTNPSDTDRRARVLLFFDGQPDVEYGRDVWVPAHSALSTRALVGPAAAQRAASARDVQVLLYDRSGGKDRLVLPPGKQRVRSLSVPYRKRQATAALVLDRSGSEEDDAGRLPAPPSATEQTHRLGRTFRQLLDLPVPLQEIDPGSLPPDPEAFEGIDYLVLASNRVGDNPAGTRALRRWLERGGRLWVLLDRVGPELLADLIGDALDFQVVDTVGLTSFTIRTGLSASGKALGSEQRHELPVKLVRVALPPFEQAGNNVDGWPAWFTRRVGRGKVVLTTLGPEAWTRPRRPGDPRTSDPQAAALPVPTAPLRAVADELSTSTEAEPFRVEAFGPLLAQEVGYNGVGRGTAAGVFAAFFLTLLILGVARKAVRRPELLAWLGPAAAFAAAVAFVLLGDLSRKLAPPTVAVAQVVEAAPGTGEAAIRGLLALYRTESGPAEVGAGRGGLLELNAAGLEGMTRRLVQTDLDARHWENLDLPAGLRLGEFRLTAPTPEPIRAVARFGPDGLEGVLNVGPFRAPADVLLNTSSGRNLAVRLGPEGAFRAGGRDTLPHDRYLVDAVLSDRQQRRHDLYRAFLGRDGRTPLDGRNLLLAWADPIDMHFNLEPGARAAGTALLVVPMRLERPAPGSRITVPGALVPWTRVVDGDPVPAPREGREATELHLRFQLPVEVLPLHVERARLAARIHAPSRRVAVTGRGDSGRIELTGVESPLDPIHVDITDGQFLRPDAAGGLHLDFTVGAAPGAGGSGDERWAIEYLELEVTGRTPED